MDNVESLNHKDNIYPWFYISKEIIMNKGYNLELFLLVQ